MLGSGSGSGSGRRKDQPRGGLYLGSLTLGGEGQRGWRRSWDPSARPAVAARAEGRGSCWLLGWAGHTGMGNLSEAWLGAEESHRPATAQG